MRVHELAKKLNRESKEIINLLKEVEENYQIIFLIN